MSKTSGKIGLSGSEFNTSNSVFQTQNTNLDKDNLLKRWGEANNKQKEDEGPGESRNALRRNAGPATDLFVDKPDKATKERKMKTHHNLLGAYVDSDLKQDKALAADSSRPSRRDKDKDNASARGESQGEQ